LVLLAQQMVELVAHPPLVLMLQQQVVLVVHPLLQVVMVVLLRGSAAQWHWASASALLRCSAAQ
jgi:hypothetical protein